MFHNILVGIDGSRASEQALAVAIGLARESRARLTILTAVEHPPLLARMSLDTAALVLLVADLERDACERIEAAVAAVPQDVRLTTIVSRLAAPDGLLERAASGCHDLVVVGTRGRRPPWRSVSRQIARRSDAPVLVVHADPPEPHARPTADAGRDRLRRLAT